MTLQLLKSLWTIFRDGKSLSPLIPLLKMAIQRHGWLEVNQVMEKLADGREDTTAPCAKNLCLQERVGLRLLGLTREQQELVAKMKEGKKIVCVEDLQQQP